MPLKTIDLGGELASLEWVVPDFFPVGFLTLIGAPPGTGKTAVMAELAWQLSRPSGTFMEIPLQGPVASLYVDYDGSSGVGRNFRNSFDRIRKTWPDGDIGLVHLMEPEPGSHALTDADVTEISHHIRERQIKLVVLDSFMALFPSVDTNKGHQVMGPLKRIITMASDLGVAVVVLDHLPKGEPGVDPAQRGLIGSVSKQGQCRAAHLLSQVEDAQGNPAIRWQCIKMTFSRKPDAFAFRMEFDDEAGTLRFERTVVRPERKADQAYELFLHHLRQHAGQQVNRMDLMKLAAAEKIGEVKAKEGLSYLLKAHADEIEEVVLPARGGPKVYTYRGGTAALPEMAAKPASTAIDLGQSQVPDAVYEAEYQADWAND